MLTSVILLGCFIATGLAQEINPPQYACGGYLGDPFSDKQFFDYFGYISGFTAWYDDKLHAIQFFFGHDAPLGQAGPIHGIPNAAEYSVTVHFEKTVNSCNGSGSYHTRDNLPCEDEYIMAVDMDMGPASNGSNHVVICSLSIYTNGRHVGPLGTCHHGNCGTVSGSGMKYAKGRASLYVDWLEADFCYSSDLSLCQY